MTSFSVWPVWVLFCLVSCCFSDDPVTYDGYQVWRTKLSYAKDLALIQKLEHDQDIAVWSLLPHRADFMLRSENRLNVHRMLQKQKLNHTVLILDVQRRIDETIPPASVHWDAKALRHGHRINWHTYPSLEIIDEYLRILGDNYTSIAQISTAGYSVENREIKFAVVSNGNPDNVPILITGGVHAREWIGITSALYILNHLVTNFDKMPDYMKNKDWYIMPLVNPDGYDFTLKLDRLWRKNRRHLSLCFGVDLNRNFRKRWYLPNITQQNECTESYAGRYPFSEPESVAVRNVFNTINSKKTPVAYVDFHSYGQIILHPWANSEEKSNHYDRLVDTAKKMIKGIHDTSNLIFRYGSPPEIIYKASGTALDWIHSRGVKLAYVIEGRDKGDHGFLIPPNQIEIVGREMLAAIKELAKDLSPPTLRSGGLQEWL